MKHKMFGIVAGVSALFMASGLIAGEEIKWGEDAAALKKVWSGKIKYENIDSKLCGVIDNKSSITSKKLVPVEAGKKYTLSGTFKSLGKVSSKVYYGFICYDKNKKQIVPQHSNVIIGSGTMLAQACKKGDKILVIKANKKWKKNHIVAFDVKDDFSDLPNRKLAFKIAKIVPKGENMELELTAPVSKAYPAGTKLRAHTYACGYYIYTTICGPYIPNTWKTYSGTAVLAKPGQMSHQLLRPGTAFVRVVILPNYGKKKDEKLALKDLKLTVSE